MQNQEKKRWTPGPVDKLVIVVVSVLLLLLLALTILRAAGYWLVNNSIMLYAPVIVVLMLVLWGAYTLTGKMKNLKLRKVVRIAGSLVLAVVVLLVFSLLNLMAAFNLPSRHAVVKSPSGERKLVVMRVVDADEGRVTARQSARLAADPEGDPAVTYEDWGYAYGAYPPALLGLFYRSKVPVEGELFIGNGERAGTLMVEWLDDEATVHFYVENPGPGDGGEWYVYFDKKD